MYIIGIKQAGFNTSAAILKDGRLTFAVCEERLTRQKKTKNFPLAAVKACLTHEGIGLADVDLVAVGWNPTVHLDRLQGPQVGSARYLPEFFYSVPAHFASLIPDVHGEKDFGDVAEMNLPFFGERNLPFRFIDHHKSHVASVFYMSPFDEAAVLVLDAFGEKSCTSLYHAAGARIDLVDRVLFPHSLGVFYQEFTDFMGFRPNSDEWKLMGAAPYGDPDRYYEKVRSLVRSFPADSEKLYEIDLSYNSHYMFMKPRIFNPKFVELFGEPLRGVEDFEARGYDLAAAVQKVTEEVVFDILVKLHRRTGLKNLCLSGGLAMNCVMNGKALANSPFENLFVNYASDDTGCSIGAALYAHHVLGNNPGRIAGNAREYRGPVYSDADIQEALERFRIPFTRVSDPVKAAVDEIEKGRIIAWFQGRSEYGERALGNRSIVADPRREDMKDRINLAVKYREAYRPFAPAILEERLREWFEDGAEPTPYMEKVYSFRPEVRSKVPAVVHVDGSGRLQTVNAADNPRWHALISEFERRTGVPILLNTSLNIKGEPMVESPADALNTFFKSGLEVLFMHDFVVDKARMAPQGA
jgi:carbamoyltransferase